MMSMQGMWPTSCRITWSSFTSCPGSGHKLADAQPGGGCPDLGRPAAACRSTRRCCVPGRGPSRRRPPCPAARPSDSGAAAGFCDVLPGEILRAQKEAIALAEDELLAVETAENRRRTCTSAWACRGPSSIRIATPLALSLAPTKRAVADSPGLASERAAYRNGRTAGCDSGVLRVPADENVGHRHPGAVLRMTHAKPLQLDLPAKLS